MAHTIAVRCWSCGAQHDVRALGDRMNAVPGCCFDTLAEVASVFGRAVFRQLPFHQERVHNNQLKLRDRAAEAGVTSSDPKVRAAAQAWRNRRAAERKSGKSGAGGTNQ